MDISMCIFLAFMLGMWGDVALREQKIFFKKCIVGIIMLILYFLILIFAIK
jgi:hypothetical protein